MEQFRQTIKKRIKLQIWVLCVFLGASVALLVLRPLERDGQINSFVHGFHFGIGISLIGISVFAIIQYVLALRKEDKLKKIYIEENDERSLLIYQKSGSIGINITMFGLAAGSVIAGYFNVIVFFTLIAACLFTAVVRLVLKVYYNKKI